MEQINWTQAAQDTAQQLKLAGLTQLLGNSIPWELSRSPGGCPDGEGASGNQSSTRMESKGLGGHRGRVSAASARQDLHPGQG